MDNCYRQYLFASTICKRIEKEKECKHMTHQLWLKCMKPVINTPNVVSPK